MPSTKIRIARLLLLSMIFASLMVFASNMPSLTNTRWQLTELMGRSIPSSEKPPYLIFDEKNGRYSGFGGCNRITGSYTLKTPNRIHFSQSASTLMACTKGMNTEAQLFKVLAITDSYALNGDEFQLYRARMAPLAKFKSVKN